MSIRNVTGGYRVVSKTGKNLGTFKGSGAKGKAVKRLAQVERFSKQAGKR